MPLFECANRTNYSEEALISPREAQQLIWSRFVNTRGWPGHNIPCDLYMEHLNRACKTSVAGLGANLTSKAIVRVSKCIGPVLSGTSCLDEELGLHTTPSLQKDIESVTKELVEQKVFAVECIPHSELCQVAYICT